MKKALQIIGGTAITLTAMWFYWGGGLEHKVAAHEIREYEMLVRTGASAVDRCVHAGLIAATYLQAQDQDNYLIWKHKETWDCAQAGIRQSN
jgi:hypothetical protein